MAVKSSGGGRSGRGNMTSPIMNSGGGMFGSRALAVSTFPKGSKLTLSNAGSWSGDFVATGSVKKFGSGVSPNFRSTRDGSIVNLGTLQMRGQLASSLGYKPSFNLNQG